MLPRICFRYTTAKSLFNGVVAGACVLLTVLAVMYSWKDDHSRRVVDERNVVTARKLRLQYLNNTNSSEKLIYLYNFPSFYEFRTGREMFQHCDVKQCRFTENPDQLSISDAVMFYTSHTSIKPPPKTADQIWIYFAVESPVNSANENFGKPEWENMFNWTMTYRKDSDIVFGYGLVLNRTKSEKKKDYYSIAKAKTKLVAWFVSNCNAKSERMKYVKLLQRFIPVDIYGNCGSLKCPREKERECIEMVNSTYKFYLSFENSLCVDYVSEKLYRMLKYDIIPVARGGANYTKLFPFKSVISTSDFFTVRDLAVYLRYLDSNMDKYLEYFSWKTLYSIQEPQIMPICEICERVHKPEKWRKVYKNVDHWWRKGTCFEAKDLQLQL